MAIFGPFNPAASELQQEALALRRRVKKLTALLRLALTLRRSSGFTLTHERLPDGMAECVNTVNRIKAVRGTAENIHLPDSGIPGNSHMLMMDTNNQQLADIILAWLNLTGCG